VLGNVEKELYREILKPYVVHLRDSGLKVVDRGRKRALLLRGEGLEEGRLGKNE
jgi:hypothetical protein